MDNAIEVPFSYDELLSLQETRTYAMDHRHKRIVGYVDDKEAAMQAIWKVLSTRRFAHLIYDDQYGNDLMNRINVGLTKQYLDTDVPKMIEEALLVDERITGIGNFSYEILSGDSVRLEFTAYTIYGNIEMKGVIRDGGDQY